ncbi:putative amidophosphoribosyltransferase [Paenibacillus sacheonensis]|nr:putative amidophosphoribosyltransferase [Paenibacillus sacheonensis]
MRYDAIIREWLALYKYHGHEALEPLLGEMLTAAYRGLQAEYARQAPDAAPLRFDAVIPVPVSEPRLLERGFNQAERLAARLAASEQLTLHDVLRRTRHSGKQSIKSRGDRLRDTRNLFTTDGQAWDSLIHHVQVRSSSAIPPTSHCRLLLIDDIYTTGSTVHACADALATAMRQSSLGATLEIYCLTLARS